MYSFEHSKVVAKVEEAHESSVSTMRLKKNLLLTGSTDSTVKLWDIDNIGAGQLLRYEYHHAPASSCDLSEACNVAAVGFSDGTVSLFDVRAGLKTISSKVFFSFSVENTISSVPLFKTRNCLVVVSLARGSSQAQTKLLLLQRMDQSVSFLLIHSM